MTGVQTCALPISTAGVADYLETKAQVVSLEVVSPIALRVGAAQFDIVVVEGVKPGAATVR